MSWAEAKWVTDSLLQKVGQAPNHMRMFKAYSFSATSINLKFLEPLDSYMDSTLLCAVEGVMVRMSTEDYPATPGDGTLVINNKDLGKYANEPLVIDGLTAGATYYFSAFPYSAQGVYNASSNAANRASAVPTATQIYGFKIDKADSNPNTRITYTDMAVGMLPVQGTNMTIPDSVQFFDYGDWEDAWFIKENKPCMLNRDGTVAYYLDPNDYSKKEDGTPSDVAAAATATELNAMSEIPLVWLKQWEDENYEYCQISDVKVDEDFHAYAHTRKDGTIADKVYLSIYEACSSSKTGRSLSNKTPTNNNDHTTEIDNARANGELWSVGTWAIRNLIDMLLLLIGRTEDSQSLFGKGKTTGGSSTAPYYTTTGGCDKKGRFSYDISYSATDPMKVFHIENYWGSLGDRTTGISMDGVNVRVKMTQEHGEYNNAGVGYIDTGVVVGGRSGSYITDTTMTQYGRFPIGGDGSATTYVCDSYYFSAAVANGIPLIGGNGGGTTTAGMWYITLNKDGTDKNASNGYRIACEQPPIV